MPIFSRQLKFSEKKFRKELKSNWITILLTIFLSFGLNAVVGQNIDHSLIELYKKKASDFYEKDTNYDSIMYFLDELGVAAYISQDWDSYIYSLLFRCNMSNQFLDFEGMKCFALRGYNEGNLYLRKDHRYYIHILNNMGGYYAYIEETHKAISFSLESIRRLLDSPNNSDKFSELLHSLFNLGTLYGNIGDTPRAISYYTQIISLAEDSLYSNPYVIESVINAYYSLALEKFSIHEFRNAVEDYKIAIAFIKKHDNQNLFALLENHISLANAQRELKNWEQCESNLAKAKNYLELHKRKHGFGAKEINFHNVSAKYYADIGKFHESHKHTEDGLDASKRINKTQIRNSQKADLLTTKGETYAKQGLEIKALECFHQATLQYVSLDFDSENIYENPIQTQFQILSPYLLEALILKIKAFQNRYRKSNDIKDLKAAHQSSRLLSQLADRYRQQLQTQGSQLFISQELKPAYEQAIAIALELYEFTREKSYLEEAFCISEKSKAALLSSALNSANAKYTGGVPDSVLDQERELLANISFYKKQVFEENNKVEGVNKALINQWERRIFELQYEKEQFDKNLETSFPLYFQYKNQKEEILVKEVQEQIPSNTLLLEYFAGDSALYIFGISEKEITYHVIKNPSHLYDRVQNFVQQLADISSPAQRLKDYTGEAYSFYAELMVETWGAYENYIIVPDGVLGRLPFELTLTDSSQKKSFRKLPYLFTQSQIQYAYSTQLLFNDPLNRKFKKATYDWIGFAPRFEADKRLLYNEQEVDDIQQLMYGKTFVGKTANLDSFLRHAKDYRILHLATHGYADVDNPQFSKLEFADTDSLGDGVLYAHELMNQQLNAELVVLSACETGHGSIAKGEGIMSLAWSFRYAGAPSILMSLWKAESNVSRKLMNYFYSHLSAGKTKREALQSAKMDYVRDPIPGKEHPRHWANFVLIGDASAISANFSWWWLVGLASFLVLGLYYGVLKMKKVAI